MNVRILNLLLILTLGILTNSCDNNNDSYEVIEQNISLSNSEDYEYDLGDFGDEEGVSIETQAEHFEISELERGENIIYKYEPIVDFIGTDYVEIKTFRGSDGASPNTDISIVKIIFNVYE